ncbi:unnamed protein product [Parnassius apollo]|uniref:(apollo) hypothetical protein n=1 Tax=Parnassius apollo TaxID=110799 RepID=A0A8S3X6M5_PARAO|nr:unnamed protein product [Parnassius apollo]
MPNSFKCPDCVSKQPRKDNSDTPIKVITDLNKSESSASSPLEYCDSDDKWSQIMQELKSEIISMRQEINNFSAKFDKVYTVVGDLCKRVDCMEHRLDALEQQKNCEPPSNCSNKFSEMMECLKMELNDRDQEQLLMDVEISCLPEVKGENPTHLAILIAEKLAVKLSEEDIVSAERMGPVQVMRKHREVSPNGSKRKLREAFRCKHYSNQSRGLDLKVYLPHV